MTNHNPNPVNTPVQLRASHPRPTGLSYKQVQSQCDGVLVNLTGISNDDVADIAPYVFRYRNLTLRPPQWSWPLWRDADAPLGIHLERIPRRPLEVSVGLGDLPIVTAMLKRLGYDVELPERLPRQCPVNNPDPYGLRDALSHGSDGVIEVETDADVLAVLQIVLTEDIRWHPASRPLAFPSAETTVVVCSNARQCRQITKACRQIDRYVANLPAGDIDSEILSFDPANADGGCRGLTIVTEFRALAEVLLDRTNEEVAIDAGHTDTVIDVFCDAATLVVITEGDLEDPRHHTTLSAISPDVRRLLVRPCSAARRELDDELGALANRLFGKTLVCVADVTRPFPSCVRVPR